MQDWDSRFSGTMNNKMYLRRVARTEKGYLGVMPDSSRVRDTVWLLQCAKVPFVLRRVRKDRRMEELDETEGPEGDGDGDRDQSEIVGESYVHGVMQGEVWDKLKAELGDVHLV